MIDRLEQKGLVAREVSSRDRRARVLTVTQAGQDLLARVRPVVRDLQGDILSGLDEAETAQLLALLKKTTDAGNDKSRAPLTPRGGI